MGWGSWVCFASDAPGVLTIPSLVLALFQWSASLAVIIQRWTKDIGTVAYRITDLNSCAPSDGLDFLQNSPYDRAYRIIQTTTFCVSTVFMLLGGGSKDAVNSGISIVGLAELIYSSVMATRGMPLVVSGNCLLVQLNPRLGYLDSSISTTWKALSGFMGF
ncbi:hypothetical protein D9757_013989 [Collybiopsis confluens]|uniref:Uncharacterized protein n=1 Tax=Collybiopsis confluens TaxID=2823264 RepID=A0A8H5CXP7_9AGAR|nr:hypothetical protein D9757_013989 [Collybiopsis confluens]